MSEFANLPLQWRTHWVALRQLVDPMASEQQDFHSASQVDYDPDDAPIIIREEDPDLDTKLTWLFSTH